MQRPDALIPAKPGAEDIAVMKARTLWLEELYFLDGRELKSPPKHGLFTGLNNKYLLLESTDSF